MTISREEQISLETTRYYHCVSRCVRRAFLCGEDPVSGRDLNHRKQWLVEYIRFLSGVFAIRVCAYAIMSNHYHLVLYVDLEAQESWSDEEVYERWKQLFSGTIPDAAMVPVWRQRLGDLSWFMRCLNETIARDSNREDGCKGRFWEGRFKSQALVDEGALLVCMAYVDLNPVRAKQAQTPEESEFTSIYVRIREHVEDGAISEEDLEDSILMEQVENLSAETNLSMSLLPLRGEEKEEGTPKLPVSFEEYLGLLDWSGRAILKEKRGSIPEDLAPILERLNLRETGWEFMMRRFQHQFGRAAGNLEGLRKAEERWGAKGLKGKQVAQTIYQQVA